MQYEQSNEKLVAPSAPYMAVSQPLPLVEDPEIRRTRKNFLIILIVLLVISIAQVISCVSLDDNLYATLKISRGALVAESLILILFYGFGILVACRCSVIGLRVFACITILILILLGVVITLLFISGLTTLRSSVSPNIDPGSQAIINALSIFIFVLLIVTVISFIILVILVRLAFKLARLIHNRKPIHVQSI